MKKTLIGAAAIAASLAISTNSHAAAAASVANPACTAAFTPGTTTPEGAKCQAAIAKNSSAYVATLLKVRGACLSLGNMEACPNSADDALVQAAAAKASAAIAKACAVTSGLGTSYKQVSGTDVASCTLGQNHATSRIFLGLTHGAPGFPSNPGAAASDTARNACQVAMNKATDKYLPSLIKIVDTCVATAVKAGNAATASTLCGISIDSSNVVTGLSDLKTYNAIIKANAKIAATVHKACDGLTDAQRADLFSCPGATSSNDLAACLVSNAERATCEITNQQYGETASFVKPGVGLYDTIQDAVDNVAPGAKVLITSGTYAEGVQLGNAVCGPAASNAGADCSSTGDAGCTGDTCQSPSDGLQLVGCGAANDNRPVIEPPTISPPSRGITGSNVDGLHFNGLTIRGWANDGIHVSDSNGVSFRDCFGDGDDQSTPSVVDPVSTYAFFPITSTNVVIEGCDVVNVRDAGIYVGQSADITVRYNDIRDNVSGLEIENSDNADVYGNVAYHNTGGLLNFKLPNLPKQTSGGHHFFDNVSYSNNVPNFGIPGTTVSAVPQGTGFMVISEKNSDYTNNIITKNVSYGFLILDQNAINTLAGNIFSPPSVDQDALNLSFLHNHSSGNGGGAPPGTLFASNNTLALSTGNNGICFSPVVSGQAPLGNTFLACP